MTTDSATSALREIRLYVDHNVHGAIIRGLRNRGIDVLSAQQDGRRRASDPALLTRAAALNRLFFTHDDDLLAEAHRRQEAGEPFFGVAYAHPLRITIGQAIADLELLCRAYTPAELHNRVVYLPL